MRRQQVDKYTGPKTLGIDVSTYQGDVDWDEVAHTNVSFAIIRTGDGRGTDKWFKDNWQEAKRVGLIRGSYHYFRADRDGKTQAEHVIRLIEEAGGLDNTDIPPVIDIEGGTAKNLPGGVFVEAGKENLPIPLVVEECLEFLQTIEDYYGCTPLVYTGQAFHWWLSQARPQLAVKFERYPLWIASYVTTYPYMPVNTDGDAFPWPTWSLWQYTSKGKVRGIDGDVDLNWFRGDLLSLQEFIVSLRGIDAVESPPTPMRELLAEAKVLLVQLAHVIQELEALECPD